MKQRYSHHQSPSLGSRFRSESIPVIEEFSDSNIIYGPNGVGKSTLCETFVSLISVKPKPGAKRMVD